MKKITLAMPGGKAPTLPKPKIAKIIVAIRKNSARRSIRPSLVAQQVVE
jgi:hypothetical protein